MIAIGLGKLEGARSSHAHARRHGMEAVIRSGLGQDHAVDRPGSRRVGRSWKTPHHQNGRGGGAEAGDAGWPDRRRNCWRQAQIVDDYDIPMPTVDRRPRDVDEIGTNIAGTGMDLKVVNRGVHGQYDSLTGGAPTVDRVFSSAIFPI